MQSSDFRIRSVTEDDAALLADLGAQTFREAYLPLTSSSDVEMYIQAGFLPHIVLKEMNEPSWFFIIENDQQSLGYIRLCKRKPGVIYLARMYVLQSFHGTGAAQMLMDQVKNFAVSNSCPVIELSVWKLNPRAIRFYEKCGFKITGETSFQWSEERVDEDWVMVFHHPDTKAT